MGITKNTACRVFGIVGMLVSCAPKATIVAEAPAPKKVEKAPESVAQEPAVPTQEDDGLRLPSMLAMPEAGDFRSTNPTAPKTGSQSGAVISRPPTDPPSRVKPKED